MAELSAYTTDYGTKVDQITANTASLEGELKDIRYDVGVSRSSMPADRNNKNTIGMNGFENMITYTGQATQWPDWRFKMTIWLAQTNPSFETLMVKLDQS